jgi:hypothetical protein
LRNPWDKLGAQGPGPRLLDPGLCAEGGCTTESKNLRKS